LKDTKDLHASLKETLQKRNAAWVAEEARLYAEFREKLRILYGADASDVNLFFERAKDLFDPNVVTDSIEAIQNLQKRYTQFLADQVPKGTTDYEVLLKLADQLALHNITDFSGFPKDFVEKRYKEMLQQSETHKQALKEEAKRQDDNEKLRLEFASKAQTVSNYIKEHKKKVTTVAEQGGSGQALKTSLQELNKLLEEQKANLDKINAIVDLDKKLSDAHIIENKHTTLSTSQLKVEWEQLNTLTTRNIALLEKEIKMQEMTGVSAELMAEFKELFGHFDSDKKDALDRNQFKACVQSLGEQLSKQEIEDLFLQADKDKSNTINFEEFTKIMADRMTDSDSQDEVLQAFKTLTGNKSYVIADNLTDVVKPDLVQYLTETMPKATTESSDKPPSTPFNYDTWTADVFKR